MSYHDGNSRHPPADLSLWRRALPDGRLTRCLVRSMGAQRTFHLGKARRVVVKLAIRSSIAIVLILVAVIAAQAGNAAPPGNRSFSAPGNAPTSRSRMARSPAPGCGDRRRTRTCSTRTTSNHRAARASSSTSTRAAWRSAIPSVDPNTVWYVTNGLLVDGTDHRAAAERATTPSAATHPAQVNVAGDTDDTDWPDLRHVHSVCSTAPPLADGTRHHPARRPRRAGHRRPDACRATASPPPTASRYRASTIRSPRRSGSS